MKRCRLASEIIREDGLGEPHVLVSKWSLAPLEKVLAAGDAVSNRTADVVLLPAVGLDANGPLVVDHLSHVSVGTVVFFKVTERGLIQSHICTITDEGKRLIKAALNQRSHFVY